MISGSSGPHNQEHYLNIKGTVNEKKKAIQLGMMLLVFNYSTEGTEAGEL